MDITDKWLGEMGGWQAMKAARSLLAAGQVELAETAPGLVRGFVGHGKSRVSSGLRIRSRSDIENLCTCLVARREGRICEHALAVGLASLAAPPAGPMTASPVSSPLVQTVTASAAKPPSSTGPLSLFLPEALVTGASTRAFTAFLRLESGEPESSPLCGWLATRGLPCQSMPLQLPVSEVPGLLTALVEHPRVFLGKPSDKAPRFLSVTDQEIRPLLTIAEADLPATDQCLLTLSENPPPRLLAMPQGREARPASWLYHSASASLHPWHLPHDNECRSACLKLLAGGAIEQSQHWLAIRLDELEKAFQLNWCKSLQNRFKIIPIPCRIELHLEGDAHAIRLQPRVRYQDRSWPLTSNQESSFLIEDEHQRGLFYVQNRALEESALRRLKTLGVDCAGADSSCEIKGAQLVMRFYAEQLPALEREFDVVANESWQRATRAWLRIQPSLTPREAAADTHIHRQNDLLTLHFNYKASDGFHLSRNDVLRLLRTGQRSLRSNDGKRYFIDFSSCEQLEEILEDAQVELTTTGARIQPRYAECFLGFVDRRQLAQTQDESIDLNQLRSALGPLGDHLRHYQLEGAGWLIQRLRDGQGALLGDDMGLGKTLQSIAAMQWQLDKPPQGRESRQALIICPKSLISNWQAELARFAPNFKVGIIQGNQRVEDLKESNDKDVLITSYQLIARDLEHYQNRRFCVGILDEASFIRNPDTVTAKAVQSLHLESRLALSGTPIENGVRDLWSIFQFLLPGYLGSRQQFQERFEKTAQAPGSAAGTAVSRLQRLIRPFFLRRTKSEVLSELPEKMEQVLWCEPSSTQAEVYRKILEEGREEIRSARRRSGATGARMTMLTVLLRLRQSCCDLRLTGISESVTKSLPRDELSGKWPVLEEALGEALAGDGKTLIFSQFVSYLRHARELMEELSVGYSYLDGSTSDRKQAIENFQNEPDRRVFLISLKAGGYGLNLTQADRVFLLDPWWNPAVEAQAIDRAHRFGQTRAVNAYRLIIRGSVEERILELQGRKKNLIASAIEERSPMMGGLSDTELSELLEE